MISSKNRNSGSIFMVDILASGSGVFILVTLLYIIASIEMTSHDRLVERFKELIREDKVPVLEYGIPQQSSPMHDWGSRSQIIREQQFPVILLLKNKILLYHTQEIIELADIPGNSKIPEYFYRFNKNNSIFFEIHNYDTYHYLNEVTKSNLPEGVRYWIHWAFNPGNIRNPNPMFDSQSGRSRSEQLSSALAQESASRQWTGVFGESDVEEENTARLNFAGNGNSVEQNGAGGEGASTNGSLQSAIGGMGGEGDIGDNQVENFVKGAQSGNFEQILEFLKVSDNALANDLQEHANNQDGTGNQSGTLESTESGFQFEDLPKEQLLSSNQNSSNQSPSNQLPQEQKSLEEQAIDGAEDLRDLKEQLQKMDFNNELPLFKQSNELQREQPLRSDLQSSTTNDNSTADDSKEQTNNEQSNNEQTEKQGNAQMVQNALSDREFIRKNLYLILPLYTPIKEFVIESRIPSADPFYLELSSARFVFTSQATKDAKEIAWYLDVGDSLVPSILAMDGKPQGISKIQLKKINDLSQHINVAVVAEIKGNMAFLPLNENQIGVIFEKSDGYWLADKMSDEDKIKVVEN